MQTRTYLFLLLQLLISGIVEAAPNSLTYQGRILKADGSPLEYNNVSFLFEITNPAGSCVIYREQRDGVNMVNSGGVFDVPIGTGNKLFPTSPTKTLLSIFDNTQTLDCGDANNNVVSSYTPAQGHSRLLRVQFFDGTGWKIISPDNEIRSVPFAAFAESAQMLGNKTATDFILKTGVPTCAAGTFLSYDGTNLSCAPVAGASGGTVTNVTASAPLSVVNGTSTPSLSISQASTSTNGYLSSADWNTFNSKQAAGNYITALSGDVTASGPNTAAATVGKLQGNTLTITSPSAGQFLRHNGTAFVNSALSAADIPSLDWSKISSGKPTTLSGYGITDSLVANAGGSPSIQTGLDANKPVSPAAGAIYFATDSKVIYQYNSGAWISIASATGSGGTITGVTAGTGLSGGGTSGAVTLNLANTTVAAGSYTRANITVDAQGRLTAASNGAKINLGTEVIGTLPIANGGTGATTSLGAFNLLSPLTTKGDLVAFDGTNNIRIAVGTNGQVLSADSTQASGLKWVTPTNGTVTNVTGTAPIVVSNGSTTPAISVNDATASSKGVVQIGAGIAVTSGTISADPANFPSAVPVSKGGTGSTTMTANRLVASDGTGSSYIPFNCGVGQVITFNASGVAGCTSFTAAGFFINGGNSFGANASLGTNDAYTLSFKTNNSVAMTIDTRGNVGIGTSNPISLLQIGGSNYSTSSWTTQGSQLYIPGVTVTDTTGSGTIANRVVASIGTHTLAASSAETITNAASFYIASAPSAGSNVTITNPLAFLVGANNSSFLGSVGIGTTSPAYPLEITSPGFTNYVPLALYNSGTAGGLQHSVDLLFDQYDSNALARSTYGKIRVQKNSAGSSSGFMSFYTTAGGTNSERMRIDSAGNVGIGTNSPATNLHIQNSTSGDVGQYILNSNSTDATAREIILLGQSASAGKYVYLAHYNDAYSTPGYSLLQANDVGGLTLATGIAAPLRFSINAMEKMRVDSNGNVGIGTTSPMASLHIGSAGTGNGAYSSLQIGSDATATNNFHWVNEYSSSTRMLRLYNGNLGTGSALMSVDSTGGVVMGEVGAAGPAVLSLKPGSSNHVYMQFFARTATPTTRSGYVGIPGPGSTSFNIANEMSGGIIDFKTNNGGTLQDAATLYANGNFWILGAYSNGSDRRLKKDIQPLENNLDKVLKLNPVSYHWKDPHADPQLQTGFIAQEVEEVYPHVVSEGKNGLKGVSYTSLIAPLTGAVQELYHKVQAIFADHENRLAQLESKMSELQKQNTELKQQNEELLELIKSQNEKTQKKFTRADK